MLKNNMFDENDQIDEQFFIYLIFSIKQAQNISEF